MPPKTQEIMEGRVNAEIVVSETGDRELCVGCSGLQKCIEEFGRARAAFVANECGNSAVEQAGGYTSCGYYFQQDVPLPMRDFIIILGYQASSVNPENKSSV